MNSKNYRKNVNGNNLNMPNFISHYYLMFRIMGIQVQLYEHVQLNLNIELKLMLLGS